MEKRKLKSKKRICSKISPSILWNVESVLKKKRKGCGGKDIQKKGFKPRLKE